MDHNPHHDEEHELSEKKVNTDDHKGHTAIAAIMDPKFPLPTLTDKSSPIRYVLSFGTLFGLLAAGIFGAQMIGTTMLQSEQPLLVAGGVFVAILTALFFTGTVWIDWFELVLGYWWLSIPIGALAGLALVLNEEASAGMEETA